MGRVEARSQTRPGKSFTHPYNSLFYPPPYPSGGLCSNAPSAGWMSPGKDNGLCSGLGGAWEVHLGHMEYNAGFGKAEGL